MINCSNYVADKTGVVVFVRKDGQYFCSENWDDAFRLIFETKATIEYIDLDAKYSTCRIDAKADAANYAITLYVPAECGKDSKLLEIIYSKSEGINGKEVPSQLFEEIADMKEMGGTGAGSGGVQSDWNQNDPEAADYVKNRPYYKTQELININDLFGDVLYPLTLTTVSNGTLNIAQHELLVTGDDGATVIITLNGQRYTCVTKSDNDGILYTGANPSSLDFSEYPFVIMGGTIVTETPGEYVLDMSVVQEKTVINYGFVAIIETQKDSNRNPYLLAEDAKKIKEMWENGIPVRVEVSHKSLAYMTTVTEVTSSFIFVSGANTYNGGMVFYGFSVNDGSLYEFNHINAGNVEENGDDYPKLFINNRWYKITVGDSGNLIATEVTK